MTTTIPEHALLDTVIESYAQIYGVTHDLPPVVADILFAATDAGVPPTGVPGNIVRAVADALFAVERKNFDSSALRTLIPNIQPAWLADVARIACARHALLTGQIPTAQALLTEITPGGAAQVRADIITAFIHLHTGNLAAARQITDRWPGGDRFADDLHDILGHLAFWNGDFKTASKHFTDAGTVAFDSGQHLSVARALRKAAAVETITGTDDARNAIGLAYDLNTSIGSVVGLAELDAIRALAVARSGDFNTARTLFNSARGTLTQHYAEQELGLVSILEVAAGFPARDENVRGTPGAILNILAGGGGNGVQFDDLEITTLVWRSIAGL